MKKGISLITLIITIIVVIILAGIVIITALEGGLIKRSKLAVNLNEIAHVKESISLFYLKQQINEGKEHPVLGEEGKVSKDTITDENTGATVAKNQGVEIFDMVDDSTLYYLDTKMLGLKNIPTNRYFMDTNTQTVFIMNGISVNEEETEYIYVLDDLAEAGEKNTNILAEDKKIHAYNNNTFIIKDSGELSGVGAIDSNNSLALNFIPEYNINYLPQTANINVTDFVDCKRSGDNWLFKTESGEMYGRGSNLNGELGLGNNIPAYSIVKIPIDNVKQFEVVGGTIFYLKNDGTLWACGRNKYYQFGLTVEIIRNTDDIYIPEITQLKYSENGKEVFENINLISGPDGGGNHSLFIQRNDGQIWANIGFNNGQYGEYATKKNDRPLRLNNLEKIVKSKNTKIKKMVVTATAIIHLENKEVFVCGLNQYGIFGNNSVVSTTEFAKVNFAPVEEMFGNAAYTVYYKTSDGKVYGTGLKAGGNDRAAVITTLQEVKVSDGEKIVNIVAGNALTDKGNVYKLHYDENNQYNKKYDFKYYNESGNEVTNNKIAKIYANLMIGENRKMWTFVSPFIGDKGRKAILASSVLKDVKDLKTVPHVHPILSYVDKNNKIKVLGDNLYNTISSNSQLTYTTMQDIQFNGSLLDETTIKIYKNVGKTSYIIDNDGYLWVRGMNYTGSFGNESLGNTYLGKHGKYVEEYTKTSMNNIANIYVHENNPELIVLKKDNTLWCTGWNGYGSLGLGDKTTRYEFTQLKKDVNGNDMNFANIKKITDSFASSVALLYENGDIYTWGDNTKGQLGLGVSTDVITRPTKLEFFKDKSKVVDVYSTTYNIVYLLENGDVYVSGNNSYGQLGNGDSKRNSSNIPVKVQIEDVKEIYVGSYHIVAMKKDRSVWSWGAGQYGQLGNGKFTDSVVPVGAYQLVK